MELGDGLCNLGQGVEEEEDEGPADSSSERGSSRRGSLRRPEYFALDFSTSKPTKMPESTTGNKRCRPSIRSACSSQSSSEEVSSLNSAGPNA